MNARLYVSGAASEGRRVACGCDGRASWGCDGRAACGPATVVPHAVVRWSCRVWCCDGRAARAVLASGARYIVHNVHLCSNLAEIPNVII